MTHVMALFIAASFLHGYGDGADIRGPRSGVELRRALESVKPALDACLPPGTTRDTDLFVDASVLAAGFVDRVTVFAGAGLVDDTCIARALRTMKLMDRGTEPATRVVLHLAMRRSGVLPRPTPRQLADVFAVQRSSLQRCIESARRSSYEHRTLAGSVIVRLRVVDERSFAEPLAGTIRSDEVRACVARVLSDVRVAGVKEQSEVAWPVVFAPPPKPRRRPRTPWESPTLFHLVGCADAFRIP